MIAVALCVVAVDLLRSEPPRSRWVLLVLLALVASGSKSTILPLAGLGFAFAFVQAGTARQSKRTALLGGLLSFVVFLAAVLTIFGGSTWGTEIKPFKTFSQLSSSPLTTLLSWGLAACGMWFLGRKWRDVGTAFLMGFAVAGLLGTLLTAQSGISQLYFLRTAFPAIAVLGVRRTGQPGRAVE